MVNVLDLFSGIGGFSLGLERAGMRTVAFCESNSYCRAVLRRHWPDVPIYDDVRILTAETLTDAISSELRQQSGRRNGSSGSSAPQSAEHGAQGIDLICGGFPCQDISFAGKGAGIEGTRSGLWAEFARIIGEVRPRYVIVENVAALLGRGIERVLGDLATLGFDAEWHCISASAVGAPHLRDRVWIIAYATELETRRASIERGCDVANTGWLPTERYRPDIRAASQQDWWLLEPDVGRLANGVSARVDRLRALGNAVVPQIPEIIGRAIMRAKQRSM